MRGRRGSEDIDSAAAWHSPTVRVIAPTEARLAATVWAAACRLITRGMIRLLSEQIDSVQTAFFRAVIGLVLLLWPRIRGGNTARV